MEKQRGEVRLPMNFFSSFAGLQGVQIIFLALKTFWTCQQIPPSQPGIENTILGAFHLQKVAPIGKYFLVPVLRATRDVCAASMTPAGTRSKKSGAFNPFLT